MYCISVISAYQLGRWNERVPHLSLPLNVKYAADTAWEVFLLCFILFPHRYILTLTFGCDKRKAFNPTHIYSEFRPLDPNCTPTLRRTVRPLRSPRTMLGFRLNAWGLFTLPIASICNANDWVTECVSLCQGEVVFSLCISVPPFFFPFTQITHSLSLFSWLCSCVGGTSEAASKIQTSEEAVWLSCAQNVAQSR